MQKIYLILLLITCFSAFSTPSQSLKTLVEADIEKFHLAAASEKLASLSSEDNGFYRVNIAVYKYLATQDITYFNEMQESWDNAIAEIEKLPNTDARRNAYLSELYGKKAIIEFLRGDYIKAPLHIRESYNHIQANKKLFPNDASTQKMLGMYNVILSGVPQKYQWLTNALGYKGNLKTGMQQLKTAAEKGEIMRWEANFVLYYAQKSMLSNPKDAIQYLIAEQKISGESIVTDFFLIGGYMSNYQNEKALTLLAKRSQYLNDPQVFFIPFWDYVMGKSYYFKEDYATAKTFFANFIAQNKGSIYKTDANFRLGMSHLLTNDYTTAKTYFAKVNSAKRSGFDEDEYAFTTAKRFYAANPNQTIKALFRARNLCDGGYWNKSIAVLENVKQNIGSLSSEQKTEMYYRYGRIYNAQQNWTAAKTNYLMCIAEKTPETALYMQPYSCFYIGEVLRLQGFTEEARVYYKKALVYKEYSYQSGLENKCKSALSSL